MQRTAYTPYKVCDRTMRVVVESYGKVGVRRVKPQQGGEIFAHVAPPTAAAETIKSLLAADMKQLPKNGFEPNASDHIEASYSYKKDLTKSSLSNLIGFLCVPQNGSSRVCELCGKLLDECC